MTARNQAHGFSIKNEEKLNELAAALGVYDSNLSSVEIAKILPELFLNEFKKQDAELVFSKLAP
jgi:hydroxylamine reductase (hybrid-cluster protein)